MPGFVVVSDRTPLPDRLHAALSRRLRIEPKEHDVGELALFLRRERLRVEGSGANWLSPTPTVPLSVGWGNEIPRQLLWATVRDLLTRQMWLIATTHIDLSAVRPMLALVRDQLARLVRGSDGAVLLGDLNTMAEPDAYQLLLDGNWRDTHPTGDLAADPTFLSEGHRLPARIDHILVAARAVGGRMAPPARAVGTAFRSSGCRSHHRHRTPGGELRRRPSGEWP
jgi:endonuclease/exonuclease/phosphatase family metal-dependent hydrolase